MSGKGRRNRRTRSYPTAEQQIDQELKQHDAEIAEEEKEYNPDYDEAQNDFDIEGIMYGMSLDHISDELPEELDPDLPYDYMGDRLTPEEESMLDDLLSDYN